ncbi:hypothetical protein B9J78_05990 [bacterium Unc6]|nr:hypothetical protein [bacterium Unc6]
MALKKKIWVKICGIKTIRHARVAYRYGADAIGLVFTKSPRRVYFKKAKQIVEGLPKNIGKVGVFVNPTFEYIMKAVKRSEITMVQLHGTETFEFCKKIDDAIPVIKAIRIKPNQNISVLKPYKQFMIILDTYSQNLQGGSGKSFDWGFAKRAREKGYKIILSGGLNPENVQKAIRYVKPFGVDVSSGVEKILAVKDADKIKEFLSNAKGPTVGKRTLKTLTPVF